MARLVLADDHALLRAGLRRILEAHGHQVVAEVGDGLRVVSVVSDARPDVLLLDLGLPGLHGLDVLRTVRRRVPTVSVLVVSAYNRDEFVVAALRSGAAGYVLKGSDADDLLRAVAAVAAGGYYVTPELETIALTEGAPGADPDPYDSLSEREREILRELASGYINHQVARRLGISTRTVESHRASMLRKLGLKTQTDLVLYALRRGLVSLDDAAGAPRRDR
jgi:DNA-binding NarL/FixJ family response regulator